MSIDRIATASQTAYYLNQIENAGAALDKTQQQIASTKVATTYAGFGDQAQVLTATLSAGARNTAYAGATSLASTQVSLQDTQLSSLSDLAAQLKKAVSDAVANNDGTTLMNQAQSIFDQASAILNSKDSNGDYIYSGGKTDVQPVTVSSLSSLASLPAVSGAFANGDTKKSVQVADGQTVTYGLTASDVATGLMQSLSQIAQFDTGSTGNFAGTTNLTQAQTDFLTGQITSTTTMANSLSTVQAANGYVANRLDDATSQQSDMTTLYKSFASSIQDTNMADAATQLSLNQTQLQAALQVTAGLHQLSLLNYLPASSTG
jgi:flagellar hook-associated protein 3 FlgL